MKLLYNALILLFTTAGFVGQANAQRGDHRGDSGKWGGGRSDHQSFSSFHPDNSSPRQNSFSLNRGDNRSSSNQARQNFQSITRSGGGFPDRRGSNYSNNAFVQRDQRISQSNVTRVNYFRNNTVTRYSYAPKGYPYHYAPYHPYYSYAPRPYVYAAYPHYTVIPRSFVSISFGGYPYYYYNGLFYSYYSGFYQPVYAPFGIHISTLPYGYYPFYLNSIPYYYYNGVYYRNYGDNQYEVVDAPMGATVSTLPKGAKAVTVNGEKFYEFNGTYYKEGTNDKDEVVYTVVGKNGEINNSDDPNAASQAQPSLHVGDVISSLPENSRPVTINGETLYVSPDNFYFRQRNDNGSTNYEVVGTGDGE